MRLRFSARWVLVATCTLLAGCQDAKGPAAPAGGAEPVPLKQASVAQIARVYWSGDGKRLVTTSPGDGTITIWDPTHGWNREAERDPAKLGRQTFSGGGPFLWAAVAGDLLVDNIGGKLTVREISTGRTVRVLDQSEHVDANERFFLTPDGKRLVAFNVPRQELNIWDVTTGKLVGLAIPKTDHQANEMLGVSADGAEAYVLFASIRTPDGEVRSHDIEGVHAVNLKTGTVDLRVKRTLRYGADMRLVSAADGRAFFGDEVWDLCTGKKLSTGPWKNPCVVDPAGKLLVELSYSANMREYRLTVYDVASKAELGRLPKLAMDGWSAGVAFSPDRKYLAIGGSRDWESDRLPRDRRRPQPIGIIGHSAPYEPIFRHIEDRALVLYDVATQKRVCTPAFPIWPLDSDEVPDPEVP